MVVAAAEFVDRSNRGGGGSPSCSARPPPAHAHSSGRRAQPAGPAPYWIVARVAVRCGAGEVSIVACAFSNLSCMVRICVWESIEQTRGRPLERRCWIASFFSPILLALINCAKGPSPCRVKRNPNPIFFSGSGSGSTEATTPHGVRVEPVSKAVRPSASYAAALGMWCFIASL